MKRMIVMGVVGLAMAGCTSRGDERAAMRGALIGAAGGAVLGAVTGGDPLAGAAIGAAGGAAVGVITRDGQERRVYRNRDGRRYWVDDRGNQRVLRDRD